MGVIVKQKVMLALTSCLNVFFPMLFQPEERLQGKAKLHHASGK